MLEKKKKILIRTVRTKSLPEESNFEEIDDPAIDILNQHQANGPNSSNATILGKIEPQGQNWQVQEKYYEWA